EETRGRFYGVGARLSPDALGARVATVFEDGPAFAAGLRKGDLITAVDGVSMAGKDIQVVVDRIKGKEGTTVKLTLQEPGKPKPRTISIVRARITAPTVESNVIAGTNVGYLMVVGFSEPTAAQFSHEIGKLESQGVKGLI